MHTWIWPKQLAVLGWLVILLAQVFWPLSPDAHELKMQFTWMTRHWGSPIALTVMRGGMQFDRIFFQAGFFHGLHGLHSWLDLGLFRVMCEEAGIVSWPFIFWLKWTALAAWVGLLSTLTWVFLLALQVVHSGPLMGAMQRGAVMHPQPWNQAQKWPIWRRSLGLIFLLSLVWSCIPGLLFAPLIAGLWVTFAFALWWPFFGSRQA